MPEMLTENYPTSVSILREASQPGDAIPRWLHCGRAERCANRESGLTEITGGFKKH